MLNASFFILGLIVLIIASITDLKVREVPDWLSYSLIFVGLLANIMISVFKSNYWFIVDSLGGALLGFLIGLLLFYTGQWGGGDSKVIIGLFTLIGVSVQKIYALLIGSIGIVEYLLSAEWFLLMVNIALIGGLYGLLYSFYLVIKKNKSFTEVIHKEFNSNVKKIRVFILCFSTFITIIGFLLFFTGSAGIYLLLYVLVFATLFILIFYSWLFSKGIDKGCMQKKISIKDITIGDWVVEPVSKKKRCKNLLQEALDEYRIRNDCILHPYKFKRILTKKYIKYKDGLFVALLSSEKNIKEYMKLIDKLMNVSTQKKLKKKAEKEHMSDKEISGFLDFLKKENIYFSKFVISDHDSTGLNEKQVNIIKKKFKKKILVKKGIPFVPSFLIAFILMQFLGFWWVFLL